MVSEAARQPVVATDETRKLIMAGNKPFTQRKDGAMAKAPEVTEKIGKQSVGLEEGS